MILELVGLLLGAALAVIAVAFVARPFLRESRRGEEPAVVDEARLRLLEQRDRALAALKELEFDHRTGKVSDADYRALVGPLRQEVAVALQSLKPSEKRPKREVDVHA